MKTLYILVLLTLCSTSWADNWQQDIQASFDAWREQNHIPGAALLVASPAHNGSFVSGNRKRNTYSPITTRTLFGVGSITKTFVSTLILQLEAEGKLKLNEKLGQYLTQFSHWNLITIKQLLNMTSGIADSQVKLSPARYLAAAYKQPDYFTPGKG